MKKLENYLLGMILGGLICIVLFAFTSCSSSKYGCGRGNPRMSWNKMVRSINRP